MDVAEYYRSLSAQRLNIMDQCIEDGATFPLQISSHNTLRDFELMLEAIVGPENAVFLLACREYQYSLEAIILGNYRHAFSSLRLSFELFVASIYFSAHQMKLKLWLLGHEDLIWSAINDADKGVFSHIFMKAFNPELGPYRTQYFSLASTVYRECSEYVHGNPATHEDVNESIIYSASKVADFHEKATTVRLCVLFAFISRYLPALDAAGKSKVEHLVMEAFGELPEIQAEFGATGK